MGDTAGGPDLESAPAAPWSRRELGMYDAIIVGARCAGFLTAMPARRLLESVG
jgi:hypothetical protein